MEETNHSNITKLDHLENFWGPSKSERGGILAPIPTDNFTVRFDTPEIDLSFLPQQVMFVTSSYAQDSFTLRLRADAEGHVHKAVDFFRTLEAQLGCGIRYQERPPFYITVYSDPLGIAAGWKMEVLHTADIEFDHHYGSDMTLDFVVTFRVRHRAEFVFGMTEHHRSQHQQSI